MPLEDVLPQQIHTPNQKTSSKAWGNTKPQPQHIHTPNQKTYYSQGIDCLQNNQYNEAISNFKKSVSDLNASLKDAYYGIGLSYCKMGKFGAAKELVEEILKIDPNYQLAHQLLDFMQQTQHKVRRDSNPPSGKYNNILLGTHNPGCFVILVDQSDDSRPSDFIVGRPSKLSRREVRVSIVNRIISHLASACETKYAIEDGCRICVINYGEQSHTIIDDMISDVYKSPIKKKKVTKIIPDGTGGTVKIEIEVPIWLQQQAVGEHDKDSDSIVHAFEDAAAVVQKWCMEWPDSFPPIVINITSGILRLASLSSNEDEMSKRAESIMNFGTTDGNALVLNILINNEKNHAMFPHDNIGLDNRKKVYGVYNDAEDYSDAEFFFRISSTLPKTLREEAAKQGFYLQPDSRCFIYNRDEGEKIFDFLKFGT